MWNEINKLICNSEKTEIINFSSRFMDNPPLLVITIGLTDIKVMDKVRDLGVTFGGLPVSDINKLQRIQNIAARLITGAKRRDSLTAIFVKLHRLPVTERIVYEILLIKFKAMHNMAPCYISDLLIQYISHRNLRSATKSLSAVPAKVKTQTYGHRSFLYAAPYLWNSLPEGIKIIGNLDSFKSTFLFVRHFNISK